ncbi:MAG: glycerophosphodiester phosphodiesterase [Clostridia bacterium]|nr:glycerophosphodiester phosphodiesterase [Clostridia bacterium]
MSMPLVIPHRGANVYAPQNTLPAFEKSLEIGVDGFETDVHVTKDGVPVICHNYTVDETSNGKGEISSMTLSELRELDFGAYFSPRYKGTKIPTVDEFLSLVEKSDIPLMNIELKSPKQAESEIVSLTINAVKEHGLFDRLLISSFDPKLLIEAKKIDRNCKTGFLYSPDKSIALKMFRQPVEFAKSIGADALHPYEYFVLKEDYVKAAHDAGIMVNPWTVDSDKSIERLISFGVDGIITNRPDVVKGLIYKHSEP